MIKGIQITQSAQHPALVHSFWLLDDETQQARCLCSKDEHFAADQTVALIDLGDVAYREVAVDSYVRPKVEGWKMQPPTPINTRSLPSAYPAMPCASIPSRPSSSAT